MLNYESVGLLIKAIRYYLLRHQKESAERQKMSELLDRLYNLKI